ncbi:putative NAD(P)H-dependent FMN-containing oxidoreductase YwqN [bioreactor metagenome]|uniref:Putative NAD(P)H-dependent FMN-containing oxidoreductase YwqN n=1 Tax=bioreactor metagenome TaxID=1076179 RepID=A0A644Y7I6_9ZZZZ
MSKKVFVVSASPRKGGNSDTLCDEFVRGAREAGNDTEKVFLGDHTIRYCTGCRRCSRTHRCVQKDDMAQILEKMVAADVIVLATPVYFCTMNAQMKTLIDRTVPRYTELKDKDFYFIVTAADASQAATERTISGFRGFTEDCLPGTRERGIIYGTGVRQKGEIQHSPALNQAYVAGKSV